eukprot:Rhum_TRINITY_DN23729_c0_g1::Rhum_TRINITY_DN23729_c0_g1_i1::g.178639::m.178639
MEGSAAEATLERRRLRDEPDVASSSPASETAATRIQMEDNKARWHTVKKYDGRWQRVKLYDIGPPGWLFRWMNPRDPAKSRRRLGHLYWKCLKRLIMATNLLFFGCVFLTIGTVCHFVCDDRDRAWSFQFAGLLIFIPGIYATVILVKYVLCHPEFSWKMLPEPQ